MTYWTLVEAVLELVLLVHHEMDQAPDEDAVTDELPETALARLLALDAVVRRGRGLLLNGPVRGRADGCLAPFLRIIKIRNRCRSHWVVAVRHGGSGRVHVGGASRMREKIEEWDEGVVSASSIALKYILRSIVSAIKLYPAGPSCGTNRREPGYKPAATAIQCCGDAQSSIQHFRALRSHTSGVRVTWEAKNKMNTHYDAQRSVPGAGCRCRHLVVAISPMVPEGFRALAAQQLRSVALGARS